MNKNPQIRERERESSFTPNTINQGDGLALLRSLPTNSAKLVFFDPQYEKASRVSRVKDWPLSYQTAEQISQFLKEIARVLKPSGFSYSESIKLSLFLAKFWLD
ncbi:MAG: methyltransferase [Mycoplasmataceae bacterium CE_OT135]|nr:MAG: methyltransferase [Mycoplasmataceae bacterium CE_OT135]